MPSKICSRRHSFVVVVLLKTQNDLDTNLLSSATVMIGALKVEQQKFKNQQTTSEIYSRFFTANRA